MAALLHTTHLLSLPLGPLCAVAGSESSSPEAPAPNPVGAFPSLPILHSQLDWFCWPRVPRHGVSLMTEDVGGRPLILQDPMEEDTKAAPLGAASFQDGLLYALCCPVHSQCVTYTP